MIFGKKKICGEGVYGYRWKKRRLEDGMWRSWEG